MSMAIEQPIAPSDCRLLLAIAFTSQAKGKADGEPLSMNLHNGLGALYRKV